MAEKQEKRRSRRLQGLPAELMPVVQRPPPRPERRKGFRCGNEGYHPYAACFAFPRDAPIDENPDAGNILRELAEKYGEKECAPPLSVDTVGMENVSGCGEK